MIKPYYDDGQIQIWHGDCRDVLPTLQPCSVDVIMADPNYGETSLDWDVPSIDWLDLLLPLVKPSGSLWCFGSMRYFLANAAAFRQRWNFAQEIVWEKHNGSIFHADRFRRVHELLTHWYPKTTRWTDLYTSPQFTMDATKRVVKTRAQPTHSGEIGTAYYETVDGGPRMMRSVQYVRSCNGRALHPTQKPEGIMRPALTYSCPPGGLIVDPFVGSGTTLLVAREMGCSAIGIEEHEKDCEIAAKRLQQSVLPLGIVS